MIDKHGDGPLHAARNLKQAFKRITVGILNINDDDVGCNFLDSANQNVCQGL